LTADPNCLEFSMIKVEGIEGVDWRDTSEAVAAWLGDFVDERSAAGLKKLILLAAPKWSVAQDPQLAIRAFWELRAMAADAMPYRLLPIHLHLLHQFCGIWSDQFRAEGAAWDLEADVTAIRAIATHLDNALFHRIDLLASAALAGSGEVTVDFSDYGPFFPEATWQRLMALPKPLSTDSVP
jgi:hypothetical protein